MSEQTTDLERAAYLLRDAAFGRSEGRQLAAKLEVIAAQLRISAPPMSSELDHLRKENAALREDAERWKELTLQADDLLRTAWGAALKMGLANRGSDCGLSHEVRMFALHFSREGREGPGALQVTGDGKLHAWLDACARAALQGAKND